MPEIQGKLIASEADEVIPDGDALGERLVDGHGCGSFASARSGVIAAG
jgi:hypothetical protein